jgi:hypothetical protein
VDLATVLDSENISADFEVVSDGLVVDMSKYQIGQPFDYIAGARAISIMLPQKNWTQFWTP